MSDLNRFRRKPAYQLVGPAARSPVIRSDLLPPTETQKDKTMFKTISFLALATTLALSAAPTFAAEPNPAADAAYKDIEAAFGLVPSHLKAYPPSAIAGAWDMTKGLLFGEGNTLEPKVKSLIAVAVAAQIPCQYCIWFETKSAKAAGATDAEVSEAVAQAAYVRHWSTVINGMQIDFATFKAELGGE
jgi:AhpD family alkylhydroperoxidase